jgi:hypothetical protein
MLKPAIVAAIILSSLVACASVDNKDGKPQVRVDREYVTGSNIPKRNTSVPGEVSTISDKAAEEMRWADETQRLIKPSPTATGSGR